jgi:hypothetical protein
MDTADTTGHPGIDGNTGGARIARQGIVCNLH